LVGAAVGVYWYRGERLDEQAWDAYYRGRPAEALDLYRTIVRQYPSYWWILGDFAPRAPRMVRELEDYLHAVGLQESGRADDAMAAYESFLDGQDWGQYASPARESLAHLKLERAQSLHEDGEHAQAIDDYWYVLDLEPMSSTAVEESQAQAIAAIPAVFLEWAGSLEQQGDHQEFTVKCGAVLAEHPDAMDEEAARAILAQVYGEWAAQLRKAAGHEEAIVKYQIILREYPDTPTGAHAAAILAELYSEWAIQLREAEDYQEAIEKYQIILREYPDTPTAAQAEAALATTYEELAAWREKTPAVPAAEFPKEVRRDSDGLWSWTIVFKETGGKVGYTLSGEGWIADAEGDRYGPWGLTSKRGSVTVLAGGTAEDSYWCEGDAFVDGYAVFTWSGEDDTGHPIMIEEEVHLLP
jgi:tetratricopeptide (TPR) repeat protein